MVDIPGNSSTTAGIVVGGTVTGSLEVVGDHDWFRITLEAGQTVTITLNGTTLEDPYLRIRNASGTLLDENDDISSGINRDSRLNFTASTSGTYYIDVGAWNEDYAGQYQLSVTTYVPPSVWTYDQIADQLTTGYWGGTAHRFNVSAGGQITVNLTALTADGRSLALAALSTWTDIIGVNFVTVTSGGQIVFDDNEEGAFAESSYSGSFITSSHVNVSTAWLADYGTGLNTYSFQTYIHEVGHALGLGHAGNYNGEATYPYDASFLNDSWATTVMSYFSQTESTYFADLGFARNYVTTPMIADIVAMADLYGLSTTTRAGNTVYGAGWSNSMGALCLFDSGGVDTIDVSGIGGTNRIDLNPGTFSNILGEVGNVSIALGVIIENATGGSGDDVIVGNAVSNVLIGNGGFDQLFGGGGDDILSGNSGSDQMTGGSGNDTFRDTLLNFNFDRIYDFSAGDRIIFTDASLASFTFSMTDNNSALIYNGRTLYLSGGEPVDGTVVASAAAGGGVQITIQAGQTGVDADARNDFNGDGRSDVLWRHDDGRLTDWLSTVNGGYAPNSANINTSVATDWQIAGVGDFNGDGRDDIMWRHADGRITNWLGTGSGGFSDNVANAYNAVSTDWNVAGIGDFNGDGRDDILWRHDDGRLTDWLSSVNGGYLPNSANIYTSVATDWQIAGVGDFNGDGRDDIMWRNTDGRITNWLGTATGGFSDNVANAYNGVSTDWQVAGIGDFNGDGRDDILWRHDHGWLTDWLSTANAGYLPNSANIYTSVATDWQIASVGDFNGDGRDDIMWRNADGRITNWLGTATGGFSDNVANAYNGVSINWHVQPGDLWV